MYASVKIDYLFARAGRGGAGSELLSDPLLLAMHVEELLVLPCRFGPLGPRDLDLGRRHGGNDHEDHKADHLHESARNDEPKHARGDRLEILKRQTEQKKKKLDHHSSH
jgi:hypothetical protein